MMAQVSISALLENLVIAAPLLILVLMPVGLVGSAWVTNTVFDYFRKDIDEATSYERFGGLVLLCSLFGTYCYFVITLLSE